MTAQIKVAFSYLIGEFRSFTEQSFHRQVHIKKVITSINDNDDHDHDDNKNDDNDSNNFSRPRMKALIML